MSKIWYLNFVLIAVILVMWLPSVYYWFIMKRHGKYLTPEEFKQGMRKAQIIDVRERDSFNAGHILGARNIPYTTLKEFTGSLRKDQPIYIYEQRKALAVRTLNKLHKEGFVNLYVLKDGYDGWDGKIKKKKTY